MTKDYATINLSGRIQAQGPVTDRSGDGRVTIDTGTNQFTGFPVPKMVATVAAAPAPQCEPDPEPEYA